MKSDNNNSTRNTADNMKRLIKNFILILLTAMMCSATTACSDSEDSTSPRRETGTTFRRSVLIYLAAQNSLGKAGASRLDSMEIVEGASRLTILTMSFYLLTMQNCPAFIASTNMVDVLSSKKS